MSLVFGSIVAVIAGATFGMVASVYVNSIRIRDDLLRFKIHTTRRCQCLQWERQDLSVRVDELESQFARMSPLIEAADWLEAERRMNAKGE